MCREREREREKSTPCVNSYPLDPHEMGTPLSHAMDHSNDLPLQPSILFLQLFHIVPLQCSLGSPSLCRGPRTCLQTCSAWQLSRARPGRGCWACGSSLGRLHFHLESQREKEFRSRLQGPLSEEAQRQESCLQITQ